jgi:hypothetical protein
MEMLFIRKATTKMEIRTVCPDWLQTSILLISASWVARSKGVSHWCLA